MGKLFGGVPKLPTPKPVRMPTVEDPNAQAARKRRRESMRKRKGRQSTIMTDELQNTTGSGKLGASG